MRMAHIIMAYKDPSQIERLVKKMSHPNFDFYIHVDSKFDQEPFEYLASIERVYLIKNRKKIRWAGFSFTKSLLGCVQEVFETGRSYDYINSMSGQDYPLKSTRFFYDFFNIRPGKNFLAIEKYGSRWWEEAEQRVVEYHMTDFDFKGRYTLQFFLNKILPRRKFPYGYTLYGSNRATWWTIHADCAKYLLSFMEDHPKIQRFARFTWAPDEYLIPTIIMNSTFQNTVVPDNYRYLDWSQGGPNPKILTVHDFESLKKSDKLLARKFDIKIDTLILDMLDKITN
jgi:hypothetical protein